ncbi:MAG: class IV adenylate cyclase [Spirochaetia bacterium]
MRTEIEIKARLTDPESIEEKVKTMGSFVRAYTKRDTYFRCPKAGGGETDVRIRVDGDKRKCTFKDRKTVGGVEKNREHEFTISDVRSMAALLLRLGGKEILRKVKKGREYQVGELSVQFNHIEELGTFIEVEQLLSDPAPRDYREAEENIASFLRELGIGPEDYEERTYMELSGIGRISGDYEYYQ